jgi:hypothetical protein
VQMDWLAPAFGIVGIVLMFGVVYVWARNVKRSIRREIALAPEPDASMLTTLRAETEWIQRYSKLPQEEQLRRRDELYQAMQRARALLEGPIAADLSSRLDRSTTSNSERVGPMRETDRILLEMTELGRAGTSPQAIASLDQRMKEAFERDSQELARQLELIGKETSHPKPYVIPKPFRTPTIILLLFIAAGTVLELTIGSGFIFAAADTYRSAAPWLFAALIPVFAILLYWLDRLGGNARIRFPTSWLRTLIIFPLMVAMCSGMVLIAPLGWISLLGLAIGARADDLEGIVLSAGDVSKSSRASRCKQKAKIAVRGASAAICVEGRTATPLPIKEGAVLLNGRVSLFGTYVQSIRAQP